VTEPLQLTPDDAARIRSATIANIVKKIKKGGTPTAHEAKILEEATAETGGSIRTATCGVKDLAELFGYTTQRIDQLVAEGIVVKRSRGKYALWESLKGLILHRDTKKKNQWDGEEGGDYEAHRARLTAAKADVAEISAAIAKGQAHDAGAVEAVWTDMLMNCRSKLLSLPTRLAPKLRKETDLAVVKEILEAAVVEALTELAAYDPARVTNEYLSTHRLDVAPASQVDGEPVGG
jgi:phage terminase Nu1 subunit (DNA packaging protein)